MSTSINLKRMYNKIFSRSVHATYPDPTIMIFFDTKKFSTVSGMLGFCMKPLARAFRLSLSGSSSWLTGRTLQVRIGQTLSKIVRLQSGVPQGSVLALFIWNYFTGDIPTTISPHSDTAVYADDTSSQGQGYIGQNCRKKGKLHPKKQKLCNFQTYGNYYLLTRSKTPCPHYSPRQVSQSGWLESKFHNSSTKPILL